MSISSKLLTLNTAKQNIKTAISDKGISMTNVPFTDYHTKIAEIQGDGGGTVTVEQSFAEKFVEVIGEITQPDYYETYASMIYDNAEIDKETFDDAWENHEAADIYHIEFENDLSYITTETMFEMPISIYTGSKVDNFYNEIVNNKFNQGDFVDIFINDTDIDEVLNKFMHPVYVGDVSNVVGAPFPTYAFLNEWDSSTLILVADITPLDTGLSKIIGMINYDEMFNLKITTISKDFDNGVIIPYGIKYIQMDYAGDMDSSKGAYFVNLNAPLVIPNSVTSIGDYAFDSWTSNNKQLIIPNSVTSIGDYAFSSWTSNNKQLIIPNSVTSIGSNAFDGWSSNNQPLIIPNSVESIWSSAFNYWSSNNQPLIIPSSVTSIGSYAFSSWQSVPYVEIQAITPPTLANANAFNLQNDAPIYVPNESVDDYKTATQWSALASRIKPISEL